MLRIDHFSKLFTSIIFLSVTISSVASKQNILDVIFESVETEAFGEVCGYAGCLFVQDDSTTMYQYQENVIINVLANDTEEPENGADDIVLGSLFCQEQTNQTINTPANGTVTVNANNITYTPNPGFVGTDSFIYCASLVENYGFGNVDITVSPAQPLDLNLYKNLPDSQTEIGDTVRIEAEIINLNNFTIADARTTIDLNPNEVTLVSGSAQFGQIQGEKYSKLKSLVFGPKVEAFTGGNIVESGNQINVTFDTLEPNETVRLIFDVVLQVQSITQLNGSASFGVSPAATDLIRISPLTTANDPFGLIRTGGSDEQKSLFSIHQYILLGLTLTAISLAGLWTFTMNKKSNKNY
jgi:hypothetical protein